MSMTDEERSTLVRLELEKAHDTFEEIEGDADTLAGLMLELKGDFPAVHEKLEYKNFTFEILALDERRISKVKVIVHDSQES